MTDVNSCLASSSEGHVQRATLFISSSRAESTLAVEIIPGGSEAQEVWAEHKRLKIDEKNGKVHAPLIVEASAWTGDEAEAVLALVEPCPKPPDANELRVSLVRNFVLPAGGPIQVEMVVNAPFNLVEADAAAHSESVTKLGVLK
jgi:hypothetical protein